MRTSVFIASLVILVVVMIAAYAVMRFVFSRPNPPLRQATVTIGNAVFNIEVASTTISRARGLSGREGLTEREGMLFLFDSAGTHGFWMKDMKFALDMIWIKGDTVAGFSENVQPEPGVSLWKLKMYHSPEPVDKVLEVNAGTVQAKGIKVGGTVVVRYE